MSPIDILLTAVAFVSGLTIGGWAGHRVLVLDIFIRESQTHYLNSLNRQVRAVVSDMVED